MTTTLTLFHLHSETVDGRVITDVAVPANAGPWPIYGATRMPIGQIHSARSIDDRVDVDVSFNTVEPDWSEWCLTGDLTDVNVEVKLPHGMYISGTLAAAKLSPRSAWPWQNPQPGS